ncbi:HpcH/HpaI aldolase family protein [Ramlibacter alkalitolerans]|uniref:Aldolase n=1 Tax=Ramlibacter alkalitolerans TaxID=2039631 RepID=A0ABS1JH24_9BURK|nr:aldolase/citrate lyase family protein [Ramlibacter alkalitolerans]MBL0423530.1 aldolase [Ramlibacter alkalitolerans]
MSPSLSEILRNGVKEKLARDEVVASMMVRLVRGVEIARIAKSAGFDTFYIDMEHCAFSLETTSQICMAALEIGIPAFVRVPANTPEYISRVLDGGAMGVIAPHVRDAQQARDVVRHARFAPQGDRSANGGLPHLQYRSFPTVEANLALNQATMVILMMEAVEALERVEEIAAVDGVDMLLVGSNDLTAEWGVPGQYDDPRLAAAYERTIAACRRHGKHVGIGGLASRPDLVEKFVRLGARFVSTGTDLSFLMAACTQKAKAVASLSR